MSKTAIPKVFPLPTPYSFTCPNYTNEQGDKTSVVAVVVPINFKSINIFDWNIGWGCNFQRSCHNQHCIYAWRQQSDAKSKTTDPQY